MKRFWDKVDVSGDCWEWLAYKNANGYGRFSVKGRLWVAHRFAYEWLIGPVPEGNELDHLCRNRGCVNPAHLEPVTHQQNMLRSPSTNKPECSNGHPQTPENTRTEPNGRRRCRVCNKERNRRWLERQKAVAA